MIVACSDFCWRIGRKQVGIGVRCRILYLGLKNDNLKIALIAATNFFNRALIAFYRTP